MDRDRTDEYKKMQNRLSAFERKVVQFRADVKSFYEGIYGPGGIDERLSNSWGSRGSRNVVYYGWQDVRGDKIQDHSIVVRVSSFKLPRVGVKKSFTKTCTVLKDYQGDVNVIITKGPPGEIGKFVDPNDDLPTEDRKSVV